MAHHEYPGVYPELSPEDAIKLAERKVLLIDRHVAEEVLQPDDILEVLEQAYKEEGLGSAVNRTKANILIPTASPDSWYRYCTMEGGIRDMGVVAIRIKSDMTRRFTAFGRTRIDWHCVFPGRFFGLILLFSAADGALLAILHDGHIQHMRVAATVTLATRHMAKVHSEKLAIIGSGGMAWTHALCLPKARPIKKISVYSPNLEHRRRFADAVQRALGIEVVPADDVEHAMQGADIVAVCTNATEPVVFGRWLEKGMHLILTIPSGLEFDDEALKRIDRAISYESPAGIQGTSSETRWTATPDPAFAGGTKPEGLARRETLIGKTNIFTLPELLLGGVAGRENDEQITATWNEGTGVQFAAAALKVYQGAKAKGLGRALPLDWFLEDVTN